MYPPVSVLIPTYNRPETLLECVGALHRLVSYAGEWRIIIGNDGDRPIATTGRDTALNQPTGSLGANLNRLIAATPDSILLQLDDDHILQSPLDITPHVERLMSDERAGWIRLWLPECTCDGTYYYHFKGTMRGAYWAVDPQSELYGPSNRPHIKHRRFHEHFGYYPEGLKLGATEETFCHAWQERAKEGGPDVLIPVHLGSPRQWRHGEDVGVESWQSKGK